MENNLDISSGAIIKTVQEKRLKMLLGLEDVDKNKRYLMNELAETAVAVMKIETDKEIAIDEKDYMHAVAAAISTIGDNPYHAKNNQNRESAVVAPELPDVKILPGENNVEEDKLEYKDFVSVNEKK